MTLRIKAESLDESSLAHITEILGNDGIVCLPTDTVYGLAVNPLSAPALNRLFELKGRDPDKPILLFVDSVEMAHRFAQPDALFDTIAEAFWPGPLTLVTHAQPHVADRVTAGSGTVGLRWPDASVPLRLIHTFGAPITGTSANRSGHPACRTPEEALRQLVEIDVLIDGGILGGTQTSTVLDLTGNVPTVLREGALSLGAVAQFLADNITRPSA